MVSTIKNNLEARRHDGEMDRADAVQTVLIVAGFAIVVLLILAWIGKAIKDKGAQAANCIEKSNTYSSASVTASQAACSGKVGSNLNSESSWGAQGY